MSKILEGDCLEVMAGMEENSVDSIVCDPPYGLEFMGMKWDRLGNVGGGQSFGERIGGVSYNASQNVRCKKCKHWKFSGTPCKCVAPDFPNIRSAQAQAMQGWHFAWACEALRIAKPGAYLLAFGGTRTFHRLACAIEDAGWMLRDTLSWNYGSGFPKSHDVSKALDRKAGAERPRDVVPQPRSKLHGDRPWMNDAEHRFESNIPITPEAKQWEGFGTALKPAWEPVLLFQKPLEGACSEELHAITEWRRWHTKAPKESWGGKPEDEKSWHASKCYKLSKQYGLEWWERETEDGKIERWIFERRWDALEPKARGRHVVIGKNKRIVLSREQYKNKQYICVAANVLKWGCGALNIDGCRIGKDIVGARGGRGSAKRNLDFHMGEFGDNPTQGRWPANFLLSHTIFCKKVGERESKGYAINRFTDGAKPFGGGAGHPYESEEQGKQMEEIWECDPDCPARILDEQSGITHGGSSVRNNKKNPYGDSRTWSVSKIPTQQTAGYTDRGGASRFFYCAKASREERNAGLEELPDKVQHRTNPGGLENDPRWAPKLSKNNHPTVKPLGILRYLCRLVTPPGGTVLDCFAGSGSMGCAAALEGFDSVNIEAEKEYVEIAQARIEYWARQRKA